MTRYLRFEKATSRGTLGHDVGLDGVVLRQRTRKGVNKKTGRVGGGRVSSTTTFDDAKRAQAAFDRVVKQLLADRYVQVGGKPVAASAAPPTRAAFAVKGKAKPIPAAALSAFEKTHGVKLPKAYRAFVAKHGAGDLLGGFVRIHAPGAKKQRLESLAPRADELGFFPFADTVGGDTFGWKLGDAAEPAVVFVERTSARARKVAASFDALVTALTTNQRFVERLFAGLDADATFLAR